MQASAGRTFAAARGQNRQALPDGGRECGWKGPRRRLHWRHAGAAAAAAPPPANDDGHAAGVCQHCCVHASAASRPGMQPSACWRGCSAARGVTAATSRLRCSQLLDGLCDLCAHAGAADLVIESPVPAAWPAACTRCTHAAVGEWCMHAQPLLAATLTMPNAQPPCAQHLLDAPLH